MVSRYQRAAKLAILAAVLVLTPLANAAPIEGEMIFSGLFSVTGGSGPMDLEGATGIDFGSSAVAVSTGDFLANGVIPGWSAISLTDFTFDPFFGPVDPLWVVGAFEFALTSLTSVVQAENFLGLAGNGIVSSSIAGLDDAAFKWSFAGTNAGGKLQVYVSTGAPLPEPSDFSTLLMLTMALGAAALWSRRYSAVAQRQ